MKEKIIVFSIALNVSLLMYIFELPKRSTWWPGGEALIVPFVFVVWLYGHELLKDKKRKEAEAREDEDLG